MAIQVLAARRVDICKPIVADVAQFFIPNLLHN